MASLRQTVTFGYYALATLIVGLSLFAFVELRLIGENVVAGERVSEFFGITLEIRRFEKNYFLYHQAEDMAENRNFVHLAQKTLRDSRHAFDVYATLEQLTSLQDALARYALLMTAYAEGEVGAGTGEIQREIRRIGKRVVDEAEAIVRAERQFLRSSLERHRDVLLGSIVLLVILAVAIGQLLSRRVTRPLMQLEQDVEAIASGRLARLEPDSADREIASLARAFNHVMSELELRQRQLVRVEKLASLGTLLSGVAHELNNPLSNISTSSQILIEEGDAAHAEFRRELLAQIDEQTLRARHIVRTLLDYARDSEFCKEPQPLAKLLAETLRLVKGQVPTRVSVTVDIPPELTLIGDKQRLQQAFINLIGNAVEAMGKKGSLLISARRGSVLQPPKSESPHFLAFGRCEGKGEVIDIEIRDDGPGIPPDVLPRIFDPFFTTKAVGQGSGLGLFIVFEVVEEHGGCIAVESAPGQGAAFFIRLPASDEPVPATPTQEQTS